MIHPHNIWKLIYAYEINSFGKKKILNEFKEIISKNELNGVILMKSSEILMEKEKVDVG